MIIRAYLTVDQHNRLIANIIDHLELYLNTIFHCPAGSCTHKPTPIPQPPHYTPTPTFQSFATTLLTRTKESLPTLLTALFFLRRLTHKHPHCTALPGSAYSLLLTSLILGSKYYNDVPFVNKSWHVVSDGMFSVREMERMEREMLFMLEFDLHVGRGEWVRFLWEWAGILGGSGVGAGWGFEMGWVRERRERVMEMLMVADRVLEEEEEGRGGGRGSMDGEGEGENGVVPVARAAERPTSDGRNSSMTVQFRDLVVDDRVKNGWVKNAYVESGREGGSRGGGGGRGGEEAVLNPPVFYGKHLNPSFP
ncbi:hypothetical protein HDV00_000185 [Rhizophlyctis rosea]|nr:hypothetical protein HDV00_000185 [Rhizophlyctis rosea]